MTAGSFCYEDISRWKYKIHRDFSIEIDLFAPAFEHEFFEFDGERTLTIRAGYRWDGASGPAIDTKNFMRASCVHDVLYQAMRLGLLGQEYREQADEILKQIARKDGMSAIRAWYVYHAVRRFAGSAAKLHPGYDVPRVHCLDNN